jgi:hypothetical protein
MRRAFIAATIVFLASVGALASAWGGSPHFVDDSVSVTGAGNTLTASGKEAGLGDEAQVHIVLSATALCINGGSNHPKAANKMDVAAGGNFPVQNGKANFALSVTATFQPSCSPPMTVQFTNVTVSDTTNGITASVPGTY